MGKALLSALLAGVSILGACSGSDESAGSPASTDGPSTGQTDPSSPTESTPADGDTRSPCGLLAEEEIVPVLGFRAKPEITQGEVDGESVPVCTWSHLEVGHRGGFALIELIGPEELEIREETLTDVEDLGARIDGGILGRTGAGYGEGLNTVMVDMGDGGFQMFVSVYQTLDREDLVRLAEIGAGRWDQLGEDPAPASTETDGSIPA